VPIPLSEIILTLNDPELKNEVFFLAFFLLKQIYNFIYLENKKCNHYWRSSSIHQQTM